MIATFFSACELQIFAKQIEQCRAGVHFKLLQLRIDGQRARNPGRRIASGLAGFEAVRSGNGTRAGEYGSAHELAPTNGARSFFVQFVHK